MLYQYHKRWSKIAKQEGADPEAASEARSKHSANGQQKESSYRFDPYEVLGISRPASQKEIASAYKREAAKYHPDKVNHLGEELQQLAHQKMLDIQKAYQMIGDGE